MTNKAAFAVSLALVLGASSAAVAASKQTVHHPRPAVAQQQIPAGAYRSFGFVGSTGRVQEPANMRIQDQDFREHL
jgi:hypothetical protein